MALLEVETLTVLSAPGRGRFRVGRSPESPTALLDEISFTVLPGQTTAIVGEGDSGTLPLALALSGFVAPASGRIVFQDQDLTGLRESRRRPLRRQMPLLFADEFGSLPEHLTVARLLVTAHANGGGSRDKAERLREIERAMDHAGVPHTVREEKPPALSPANRQRVALARALLQHPRLLILHDFTRGLDPAVSAPLVNRLSDLQEELGLSLLLLTGDIALADHLAPVLHVLSRGKIVDSGLRESVISDPQHDYTRRLIQTAVSRHQ